MSYIFFLKLNTFLGHLSLESNMGKKQAERKGGTEILIPHESSDTFLGGTA